MLSGFNALNPVQFVYEPDTDLIINQNTFTTQQGLSLNLVNALSSLQDETISNYSNIFLTDTLPVNDVVTLPPKQTTPLTFPTYLALSAYPTINPLTYYVSVSTGLFPVTATNITFVQTLSNEQQTNFIFYDLDGLHCTISTILNGNTMNLAVDVPNLSCIFSTNSALGVFEYTLDDNGFLKLFYRSGSNFYAIRQIGPTLKPIDITTTTSLSTDIFGTTFTGVSSINFKNDFIYYNKSFLKDFIVNDSNVVQDVPQNTVLYYNYQSQFNFLTGATAVVNFFKTKNVLSNDYYINDQLPFVDNDAVQRNYTSILSKQNSETFNGDLQLGYNYYTSEYLFLPDKATLFTLPETLFPYSVINIDNSNLVNIGAYGGLTPVYSDKVVKKLNENENAVNYNEANGTYLYTWLYTDSAQLTSYWLDRYYYPQLTTVNSAYTGTNNQVFNYTSSLSTFLAQNSISHNYSYYDIRSSLTFEPSASYYYSRIGNNYVEKVVNTFDVSVSAFQLYNSNNVYQGTANNVIFDGTKYGVFNINNSPGNSFTLSFDFNTQNLANVESNLIVGNNFDEGVSLYAGGLENIFTPGYFITSLTGVDFFDTSNNNTFSVNVSSYVQAPVHVIDVINTGFDHFIKVFYLNLSNGNPGFLEFSVYDKIFNKYEFPQLSNIYGSKFGYNNLYSKQYVGNNEVQYLIKYTIDNPGVLLPFGRVYRFDYINCTYLGYINIPLSYLPGFNSFVTFNGSVSTLSGYDGNILDGDGIGVSKWNNVVYFKNLSAGTEYPSLCTSGGIFDVAILQDKFYIQTNGYVSEYDQFKTLYNTYYTSSNVVSGLKVDFINEGFETKLLSFGADANGHIIVDKFNLATSNFESTYNTGKLADPIYYGEFLYPKQGTYNLLRSTGMVNGNFVSGGIENSYTYSTPIIDSLTSMFIDAEIGVYSGNSTSSSILSGEFNIGGGEIPSDFIVNLVNDSNGTVLSTLTGDGSLTTMTVTVTNIVPGNPYTFQVLRTEPYDCPVNMSLEIINGSFVNGSFRNANIPQALLPIGENVYPGTLQAYNTNSLTEKYGYFQYVRSGSLSANFLPYGYWLACWDTANINGIPNINIIPTGYNIYSSPTSPLISLSTYSIQNFLDPYLLEFLSTPPPSSPLSGVAFQAPTNFSTINNVNGFDQGNFIARVDLFSGNDYLSKQTQILPFTITNNSSQITMVLDITDGSLNIYNNAELIQTIALSANAYFTSYYLYNNFGIGMPYINNKAASTIGENYVNYPNNYSLDNFVVYNYALDPDQVKFNYLKNQTINPINFDITTGTRNNTDTVTSFNKMIIPGRKNNNTVIYIKNAYLDEAGQANLTAQLLPKLKNIIPINIDDLYIEYVDYDFIPTFASYTAPLPLPPLAPSPTPPFSPTPTPSITPSITPSHTTTPSLTPTPSKTPGGSVSPTPSPTPSTSIPGYSIDVYSSPTVGGNVSVNGSSLTHHAHTTVAPGVAVTIQAYPGNSSLQFNGWIDPQGVLPNLTDNPITSYNITQNATIYATFGSIPPGVSPTPAASPLPTYQVVVNTDGTPGASAFLRIGSLDYASAYLSNGTYNLYATAPAGYVFSNWSGATVGNAANPNTTITVSNAPLTVQANFALIPSPTPTPTMSPTPTPSTSIPGYSVTVNSSPTDGGKVNINGGTLGTTESTTVAPGVSVTIQAYPKDGTVQFNGWIDPYGLLSDTSANPATTSGVNQNVTFTATFGAVPPGVSPTPAPSPAATYNVVVNTDGTPGASAYIRIGALDYTNTYLANGTYNLYASPSPTGYVFSNWSGATVGNSANPTTTITVAGAPLTVQANYIAVPSSTPTNTPTNTPTSTPSPSLLVSRTPTPTPSATLQPSSTPAPTSTPTSTPTPTPTPSQLGALTVTVNNATVSGSITNNSCANAVTNNVSVTSVTGGSGSYSYAWTIDNGSINITYPSSSTTDFSAFVCCPACGDQNQVGNATITVTDNNTGQTGTAVVEVLLGNTKSNNCVCF